MNDAIFLGLGANLGDRMAQLQAAVDHLRSAGCVVERLSAVYETPPWGFVDQPAFLNMVIQVSFAGEPMDLMERAMQVETTLGRVRSTHWGPRAIDIDVLAFGQREIHRQRLVLPHPQLANRGFVLIPWAEIAPDFQVVGLGLTVSALQALLPKTETDGIVRLGSLVDDLAV